MRASLAGLAPTVACISYAIYPGISWCAALRPDVSGVPTDVKIYRDPMPHVSLRGRVVEKNSTRM